MGSNHGPADCGPLVRKDVEKIALEISIKLNQN